MKTATSRFFASIICLALISLGSVYSDAQESDESGKLEDIEHTPWEAASEKIKLYDVARQTLIEMEARQTTYTTYRYNGRSRSFPVTAFISKEGEVVWIGPRKDFYVKLETGIAGATYKYTGTLQWCDSMVPEQSLNSTDLDDVIGSFEETVDAETLKIATVGADLRDLKNIKTYGHYTSFRRLFETDYGFGLLYNSHSGHLQVAPIEFLNGELKFTITNPHSGFVGEIWVDPITKQVTRTESSQ